MAPTIILAPMTSSGISIAPSHRVVEYKKNENHNSTPKEVDIHDNHDNGHHMVTAIDLIRMEVHSKSNDKSIDDPASDRDEV